MPVCYKLKESEAQYEDMCKKALKQETSVKSIPGRPIVLSQKRFTILKARSDTKTAKRKVEAARAERARLNALAEKLIVKRTPEQKLAEVEKHLEEKATKARASLKVSYDAYEALRQERIAKAELLVQKLKSGPQNLRSAAMQAEMLRGLDVQLAVNQEIQNDIKKQELADKASCQGEAIFYNGDEEDRKKEREENDKAYHMEVIRAIRNQEQMRSEKRMKRVEEERQQRAKIEAEIKANIEEERLARAKKCEILRKNATEAMKMAEERRKRNTMYDEVEDRVACVYITGHRQLEKLKSEQAKKIVLERQKQIDKNTEMLAKIKDKIRSDEAERLTRDVDRLKLNFDAEEQLKRNREKELKKQRIEAHLKEFEEIRIAKEKAAEMRRLEVARRFKNTEVNARFNEADRLQQEHRAKCVRAQLMAQEEERQQLLQEREKQTRFCDTKRFDQDDNFFFKYAKTLMEDANRKERPLYPFKKVIDKYKQVNMRDLEHPKLPRHLVSNVCVQQHGNYDDAGSPENTCKRSRKPITAPFSKVKAETLEHMAKIEALFAQDERRRAARSAKSCIPYDCTVSATQPPSGEKNDGLQQSNAAAGCPKVSYGIDELKNLCGRAPSSH